MNPLITVAHGSRNRGASVVAQAITARAARRLGVRGTAAYVELARPTLQDAVLDVTRSAPVVVPLLLSRGVHLSRDLPGALRRAGVSATLSAPLGPHPLIAEVLVRRLRGAGAGVGDEVVLVGAGSSQPDGLADLVIAGRLLQARWSGRVRIATLSGSGPELVPQIAEGRRRGRVAVAPYLLAPGHFASKAGALADAAGAHVVAEVLGADPLLAELVARRYLRALRAPARSA